MSPKALRLSIFVASFLIPLAAGQSVDVPNPSKNGSDLSADPKHMPTVPSGVILVKGAWPSASDTVTPLPEDGSITGAVFNDRYFGLAYSLPAGWLQKYQGPPPSENGRYVLSLISPGDTYKDSARGTILITADDLFFTPWYSANALEFVDYLKDHLQEDFKIEAPPSEITIAGHTFRSFAYWAPATQVHWYVAATEIRCHAVQFALTSRDPKVLESLVHEMDTMKLPGETGATDGTGGGEFPVCVKDYANGSSVISRVDPVFTVQRFNSIPVRVIIDKEGKVKHIHFLRAFPDQAKAITDVMGQWRFKPLVRNGETVEVETGIVFGHTPFSISAPATVNSQATR